MTNLLKTTTAESAPLDASGGAGEKPTVSNFLTVQSLTNFGAMTGAISVAWLALQNLAPWLSPIWVPFVFAGIWGVISIVMSWDGLKNPEGQRDVGSVLGAIFIAFINALVLASAVVGAAGTAGGAGGTQ